MAHGKNYESLCIWLMGVKFGADINLICCGSVIAYDRRVWPRNIWTIMILDGSRWETKAALRTTCSATAQALRSWPRPQPRGGFDLALKIRGDIWASGDLWSEIHRNKFHSHQEMHNVGIDAVIHTLESQVEPLKTLSCIDVGPAMLGWRSGSGKQMIYGGN